ncbi:acetate kinase [Thalassomonas sp. M1454]|uniref:acetate kinase n=1 Tax=Thalassomonas sp. M1454 TaxID=2594477 RepID=UPI00117CB51C|nr:acetate kinase [Thalassomonas sp. M1454]TRX56728.1 acetate kinase [Thalassomonas sp. M1454]
MSQQTVLVINCGSSSLKFSLINPTNGEVSISGIAERLASPEAFIKISFNNEKSVIALSAPFDHQIALQYLVEFLNKHDLTKQVSAIGHRVVHGGESYSQPTLINSDVKNSIASLAQLAPLHNPVNLIGIEAAEQAFPELKQVAVFDTAFHQSMPEKAFIYGIPYQLYKEQGIRKYGFHGTSHYFVATQAAKALDKPLAEFSGITAHLGNGCSICAIDNGESVDTSMGLTPLAGVVMGTRSGDIDPSIIFHLINQLGYSADEVDTLLNKQSGLLGISQMSNDCRTIEDAIINDNNVQANLTMDIFCYRIAKTIASYMAAISHFDALVFTGGIGENSDLIRERVGRSLALLNIKIDADKNSAVRFGKAGSIHEQGSQACLVIPTNEELVIAMQTQQLIEQGE